MIKRTLSLLAFLFLIFSVQGQVEGPERKTSFGLTAGYADIMFKSDDNFPYHLPNNPGMNDSYFVGAFLNVPLGENLLFKPEFNYLITNKSSGYLELAPLIQYYLFNSGFSILGGPQLKVITGEVADNYKRTGFEVAGGLAFDISRRWFLEAKYAYELTNRYKEDIAPTGGLEMHYETFSLGVGFRF